MNTYQPGQTVRFSVTVSVLGELSDDPSTSLEIQPPSGSPTTYPSPVHDNTGAYHQDILATLPAGLWKYRWVTTNHAGVVQGNFLMVPLSF